MKLEDLYIYRITHIDNISNILEYGITHKGSSNYNSKFVQIGDVSLINTRSCKKVYIDNGKNHNSNLPSIILGNFIPFYFGVKMPMLYIIQKGGNFVEKVTTAEKIIYLECSIYNIIQSDSVYYFSDGHATDGLTSFYDKSKINDLLNILDWDSIKAPFWGGQDNLDIKRKKQAEFLVSSDLSFNFIVGFICSNQTSKSELVNMGIKEDKIKVIPNAYY